MDIGTGLAIGITGLGVLAAYGKLRNGGNSKEPTRPKIMSEEAKDVTEKLWDEKVQKSHCETISTAIKSDISEIKDGIKDIQGRLS